MKERLTAVSCSICGKPVLLAECMSNDSGEPVHESCYATRLNEEVERRTAALDKRRE